MVILKTRADVFELHIHFKVMKLQLSIQRNYKIFYFQIFPKDRGVYLEPIQTSKMELFVKIVNSLMP